MQRLRFRSWKKKRQSIRTMQQTSLWLRCPDPGEGGPVYPGNSTTGAIGGNWDWGSNGNNHWGTSWKQLGQQLPAAYSH